MNCDLFKQYLKLATDELFSRGKINSDMKNEVYKDVDLISYNNFTELKYSDFDKTLSTGCVFSDSNRIITAKDVTPDPISASVKSLTITLNPINRTLKGVLVKSNNPENILVKMSYDNITKFEIPKFDTDEYIEGPFSIYFEFEGLLDEFYGAILIYE